MVDKDEIYEQAAKALTHAHRLAIINADSETMLAVAGWWVELFDRAVAIDMMEKDGKKAPMGFFHNARGEEVDEYDED